MNKKTKTTRKLSSKTAGSKKVNKSAAIREFYVENPNAKPSEIVASLAKRGITVSAQQVSTTRMNAIKNGKLTAAGSAVKVVRSGKRGRPAKKATTAKKISKVDDQDAISMKALLDTQKLVERVGMSNVKNAIVALERILG